MADEPAVTKYLHIVNPWELVTRYVAAHLGEPTIYLDYRAADSQQRVGAAWQVIDVTRRRTDPDPDAYYRNYGRKTFATYEHGYDRKKALAAAQEWASERYGITEWASTPRTRGGTAVVPAPVAAWVRAELAAVRKREKQIGAVQ